MNLLRCIQAIDEAIGKIRKVLKEIDADQNTIIIFSSDNGYFMGEHLFKTKG